MLPHQKINRKKSALVNLINNVLFWLYYFTAIPTASHERITNPHGNLFQNMQCSNYFISKIEKMEAKVFDLNVKLMNSENKYNSLLLKNLDLQKKIKLLKQETSSSAEATEEDPINRPVANRLVKYELSSVSSEPLPKIDPHKVFNESDTTLTVEEINDLNSYDYGSTSGQWLPPSQA